jgi:hypothetical protein
LFIFLLFNLPDFQAGIPVSFQAEKGTCFACARFLEKILHERSECGDFFQNREAARPCTGVKHVVTFA